MDNLAIDIDLLDDILSIIENRNQFGEDLEHFSFFNKMIIPKSIATAVPAAQKLNFIFMAFNMGLFDLFREPVIRKSKVVRDRKAAWDFILTWSDSLFHRQFFIAKDDFFKLC